MKVEFMSKKRNIEFKCEGTNTIVNAADVIACVPVDTNVILMDKDGVIHMFLNNTAEYTGVYPMVERNIMWMLSLAASLQRFCKQVDLNGGNWIGENAVRPANF